jgi:hypothetical protein
MTCSVCSPESPHSHLVRICDSCLDRLVSLGCYAEGDYDQASYWITISDEMEFAWRLTEMAMQLEEEFDINVDGDLSGERWLRAPSPERRASATVSYGCAEPDGHLRPILDAIYHEILRQSS